MHDLPRLVAATPIGGKLDLRFVRGGKEQTLVGTIAGMPSKTAAADQGDDDQPTSALGMELVSLSPSFATDYTRRRPSRQRQPRAGAGKARRRDRIDRSEAGNDA